MAKLSAKHARFVAEYLIDTNGTQAAIRAGYSKKTAHVQGSRLLRNAVIRKAVQAKQAKQLQRAEMTADHVIAELEAIARTKTPRRVAVKEKIRALELLGKKHRLFVDRTALENADGTPLNLSGLTPAQLEDLEKLLAIATPAVITKS